MIDPLRVWTRVGPKLLETHGLIQGQGRESWSAPSVYTDVDDGFPRPPWECSRREGLPLILFWMFYGMFIGAAAATLIAWAW